MGFDIKDGEKPSIRVGIDCDEGPPVPIPNTEVKLSSAEDSWLEAACENRKTPTFIYSSIAQSVERMTVNHDVAGSSPARGATSLKCNVSRTFFFFKQLIQIQNKHINLQNVERFIVPNGTMGLFCFFCRYKLCKSI